MQNVPFRELCWNISRPWLIDLFFLPFAAALFYGCYRLLKPVWAGQREVDGPSPGAQVRALVHEALLQRRLLGQPLAGGVHLAISWGFAILFVATCLVAAQTYLHVPTLRGAFYLVFMSLAVDLFGLAATLAVAVALVRRYAARPERLWKPRNRQGYGLFLWLLFVILLSGFLVEGLRIAATADPWGRWSPGGWLAAAGLAGLSPGRQVFWHRVTWWGHGLLAFSFLALLPFTLIRHVLAAPANIALRRTAPSGMIAPAALEEAEHFGVSAIRGFPRKDLLDLIACTECGRCQDACPAWATGKPLTPKGLILDLRDHLLAESSARSSGRSMVGQVVSEEALWACTTCGACQQACPVFIQPIPKIVEMRRFLVMEEARFPETMQAALRGLETRGHPYQGAVPSRTAWTRGLDVPLLAEKGTAEHLYWVGCAAAFDERAQKVARAFVTILKAARVDFAILGDEEQCTGDVARRIGSEFLFQMHAQANIETLGRYGVRRILTTCPHCFNTLKHEYPAFGGRYEVLHHTEFIAHLIGQDRVRLTKPLGKSVAYHDPCYLARHNGVCAPPREILSRVPGLRRVEFERHGADGFCCGAGGGLIWQEERAGTRVNVARTEEALRVRPDVVGTACPFCLSMFEDGIRATDALERLQALDLAEIVVQAM
jgi:Fe-S oxidoreductase